MFEEVQNIIAEVLDIDKKEIKLESNLANDLAIESLDLVDLVAAFEKKYQVKIPDQDIKTLQTVQDIVNYIESKNV